MAPNPEPLGYAQFLCDVNVEFTPGGKLNGSISNRQNLKLKHLPYLVAGQKSTSNESKIDDSASRDSDAIQESPTSSRATGTESTLSSNNSSYLEDRSHMSKIDISEEFCGFLGNSDFVPTNHMNQRRIVIELLSAKLSQPTTYNVHLDPDLKSSISIQETSNEPLIHTNRQRLSNGCNTPNHEDRHNSSLSRSNSISSRNSTKSNGRRSMGQMTNSSPILPAGGHTAGPSMVGGKRFVNYTLLIKRVPGLDNYPTVIDRRFSDFAMLYQAIKGQDSLAELIEKSVNFPKKVLVGNFSFPNIAERGVEFSRLLDLCLAEDRLTWCPAFISFLLDKELREAHKIVTCGDPDDVLAPVETAFGIEMKIYLPSLHDHHSVAICKRLVITFAMLLLTYYRANNLADLSRCLTQFRELVAWPGLARSIQGGRYHTILKATIKFLIDVNEREAILHQDQLRPLYDKSSILTTGLDKITLKRDLISLLNDRNFCSFQDGAVSLQEA